MLRKGWFITIPTANVWFMITSIQALYTFACYHAIRSYKYLFITLSTFIFWDWNVWLAVIHSCHYRHCERLSQCVLEMLEPIASSNSNSYLVTRKLGACNGRHTLTVGSPRCWRKCCAMLWDLTWLCLFYNSVMQIAVTMNRVGETNAMTMWN